MQYAVKKIVLRVYEGSTKDSRSQMATTENDEKMGLKKTCISSVLPTRLSNTGSLSRSHLDIDNSICLDIIEAVITALRAMGGAQNLK